MITKSIVVYAIFVAAIGLSVGCRTKSIKIDLPEYKLDKYTDLEYKELLDACDSVISEYANEVEVSNHEQVKNHLTLLGFAWNSFYGKTVPAMIDSTRTDYFIKRDSAIKVLGRYQEKMFPKYRKVFANYFAELLWEEDCKAEVYGDNNEILELSGNYFLPNANKKRTFESLKDVAERMRFKVMRFRWYSSASDFFDYEINSSADKAWVSN